jgi:curved DNA-binding protein CbpA
MSQSLILLDTDKVKNYVFATGRLKEIRGASELLEDLNRRQTEEQLKQVISPNFDLIYNAGGSAMAIVPSSKAEEAIRAIQKLYRQQTTSASISAAILPLPDDHEQRFGDRFGELAYLVGQKLRQVKDEATPLPRLPLAPWFRDCTSCGRDPAEHYDEGVFLCRSCWQKRQASQRSIFWDEFRSGRENVWKDDYHPEDFGDIGQTSSPSGYIGFIYADGNGMGEVLGQLKTKKEYKAFSKALDRLTRDVTYQALAHYIRGPRRGQTRVLAPFEVLLVGGDDLMLITAADLALPVAAKIVEDFESRSEKVTGQHLSLSAGVVLAHSSYPIAAMSDLAAELLASAKKESTRQATIGKSNQTPEGALDFMVVTAASSRELEWVRDEALTHKSFVYPSPENMQCELTQRPYPAHRFARLYDTAIKLQKENFPNSQLQVLYDSLFMSFNTASFSAITALARLRPKHRKLLKAFIHDPEFELDRPPPWHQEQMGDEQWRYSTALGDLVEVYRFVSIPRS